jgi:hypothetical protein
LGNLTLLEKVPVAICNPRHSYSSRVL